MKTGYKVYRILPTGRLGNPMYLPHVSQKFEAGKIVEHIELMMPSNPVRKPTYKLGLHFFLTKVDAHKNLAIWKENWFYGPAAIINVEGPGSIILEDGYEVCVSPWIR